MFWEEVKLPSKESLAKINKLKYSMYIKIDGTNTESLPCRGSTLEKFTAKINRIKIVNGMDKFHWFWDFEDLIEKSNNLLNDNPEIEFLELSTGIDTLQNMKLKMNFD